MSLRKSAGIVSLTTFLSRIFGVIREQIFAALLGAGYYSDAFLLAFRIPNLLRDLLAEGALSSAFVPTFTVTESQKGTKNAWDLANLTIGTLLALTGLLTLIGILFAPQIAYLVAHGFDSVTGKRELTILLTRIMFPFLPTVALAAIFMGMLNAKEKFGVPAFAPVMFNLVSIVFGAVIWVSGFSPKAAVIGWAIGTLLGGVAQAAIQFPSLLKLGYRFKPTLTGWKEDEGLRQIGRLMVPAVIGLSATQVNILVNSMLASLLEEGSVSWLNFSFRLMQLPIGVFGVAIGMVTLPKVSRDAATASNESFRTNLTTAMNLVLLLTIPSAVGLYVLGVPIIHLIYEHGRFGSTDTLATAGALACYALGLPAYAAIKVLAPAFYALKDAKSPMIASITAVAINILFNVLCYQKLGHRGLALGTSISATTNLLILIFWFQTKQRGLDLKALFIRIVQVTLAAGVMGVVARVFYQSLHIENANLVLSLTETLAPMAAGIAVYFILLAVMKVPEMKLAKEVVVKAYHRIF